MIRALYRPQTGPAHTNLTPDEFAAALQDPRGLLWIDLDDEPPQSSERILREIFDFHPLAIDDALEETHVPKLDDWGDYLYLVLRAVVYNPQADEPVETPELDLFVGKNFIVTYHEQPITAVDQVWAVCQKNRRYLRKGAGYLLYNLVDELVASSMLVVEQLDDAIDLIEDQLFDRPDPEALEQIFTLKRSLLHLRRIILPQREVLNKLARDNYAVIKARDRVFFRDVYDHLVRLHDIIDSMRDLLGSAMNTYLSVVNNRMNDVMKTLTIITTLFMPLSFIVGFFGMNFFEPTIPLAVWTGRPVFLITVAIMLLLPVSMLWWVRWRGWL